VTRDPVEIAIDKISDQTCPIDGSRMWQHTEFDEYEHRYEQCEANDHRWPLKHGHYDDWYPEREVVEEKLEEYGHEPRA
jgi:hypothetical protein